GASPVTADQPAPERPQSSVLAEALGTVTAAFQPTIGPRGAVHDSFATSMAKSAMRAASSQLGRQITRGLLGGIFGGSGSRKRYVAAINGSLGHGRRQSSSAAEWRIVGETRPKSVSFLYKLGLAAVALVMVLLPIIYVGIIALVAWDVYEHALH